jgi:hypothetical protein
MRKAGVLSWQSMLRGEFNKALPVRGRDRTLDRWNPEALKKERKALYLICR